MNVLSSILTNKRTMLPQEAFKNCVGYLYNEGYVPYVGNSTKDLVEDRNHKLIYFTKILSKKPCKRKPKEVSLSPSQVNG